MNNRIKVQLLVMMIAVMAAVMTCGPKTTDIKHTGLGDVEFRLTTADKSKLFALSPEAIQTTVDTSGVSVINVDTAKTYQTIDGFGYALTGGSAMLINKLDAAKRSAVLKELFLNSENNIGLSYLRVSIGASDLDDHVFSYDDLKSGQKDIALKKFTLKEDEANLIPVLKEIVGLNPSIKIMGSPWSAPAWMKTNNSPKGGSLKLEFYNAYADYFVKYIQGMAQHGITIDAITLQNEPENPKNNPSMLMTALEQAAFVKGSLGPAFAKAGIKTKIIIFDHNCDHPEYPITALQDTAARKYIDGSAFHLYLGEISALSKTHDAHPDKNIYFTEQWTSGDGEFGGDLMWHVKNLVIGATQNWSRNVLEWNLAADPAFNPHTTDGGCDRCLGALTIGDSVTRNVSYYIIAHASKHVTPGSVRVGSSSDGDISQVAFVTPEGKKVLVILNEQEAEKKLAIRQGGGSSVLSIPGKSVGTLVWK